MKKEHVWREEFNINGELLVSTVKQLIHQGDIRRISIKDEQGQVLIEIPLLAGAIVAMAVPVLAAVGAIGAIVSKLTVVVEKGVEMERSEQLETIAEEESNMAKIVAGFEAEGYGPKPHEI